MKIRGFKKRFSSFDILLVLFIWILWSALDIAYQNGAIHYKSFSFNRSDNFFMFWSAVIVCIVTMLFSVYLLLFENNKPRGPKYDQDGNVYKDL